MLYFLTSLCTVFPLFLESPAIPGWSLFFPAIVFLSTLLMTLGVELTHIGFCILALETAFLAFLAFKFRLRKKFPSVFLVFALSQLILFWWLGPYLEIPSDPVGVHLFRISEWLFHTEKVRGMWPKEVTSTTSYLGYLWQAVLMSPGKLGDIQGLSLVSLAGAFVLAVCFYRFLFTLTGNAIASCIGVLMTELTLGTVGHSYYRYYSLGPGILNFAVLLDFFSIVLQEKKISRKTILYTGWIFLICLITHHQEVIYLLFGLVAYLLAYYEKKFHHLPFKKSLLEISLFIALFYVIGYLRNGFPASHLDSLPLLSDARWRVVNLFSFRINGTFNLPNKLLLVANLGIFFFFRKQVFQSVERRKAIFLLVLCLIPFFIFLFPALSLAVSWFIPAAAQYRFLYFAPFVALYLFLICLLWKHASKQNQYGFICFLVFISILTFRKNAVAKDFFRRSHPLQELNQWPELYQAIKDLGLPKDVQIVTDALTAYPLLFFTGHYSNSCFKWRCYFPIGYKPTENIINLKQEFKVRPLWVLNNAKNYTLSTSTHWPTDVRRVEQYYLPETSQWIEQLENEKVLVKISEDKEKFTLYESSLYEGWEKTCTHPGINRQKLRSCQPNH